MAVHFSRLSESVHNIGPSSIKPPISQTPTAVKFHTQRVSIVVTHGPQRCISRTHGTSHSANMVKVITLKKIAFIGGFASIAGSAAFYVAIQRKLRGPYYYDALQAVRDNEEVCVCVYPCDA